MTSIAYYPDHQDDYMALEREAPQLGTRKGDPWRWKFMDVVLPLPLRVRRATDADQFIQGVQVDWVLEEVADDDKE